MAGYSIVMDDEQDSLPARADRDQVKPFGQLPGSPERSCITCLTGILLILLSVAMWAYIYWRNTPEIQGIPH